MTTFKDEEGNDVEAMTTEEVEAAKQEAIEAYKAENPDKSEEMETLKKSIEEKENDFKLAQEELEKLGKKDFNFQKLREQNKNQESELGKLKTEMSDKLEKAISTLTINAKEDLMSNLVGDDEDLRKKVEYHYDRIKDDVRTKKEIEKKLSDAFFLATRQEVPVGGYVSSAGAGNAKSKSKITQGEKELGNKLGITDEDFKKYNNK